MKFKTVEMKQEYLDSHFYPVRMQVHAYGLLHPSHMEWTTDGKLLVSEFGRGRVVDITAGGDFRDAEPFAFGLVHPAGLITNYDGDKIVVADSGQDSIVDISNGGDVSNAPVVFSGIPAPYGMVMFKGSLLATYTNREQNGVTQVDARSPFSATNARSSAFPVGVSEHPYVIADSAGCGHWTAEVLGDRLLLSQSTFGTIYDITDSGSFDISTHKRFAWGLNKPVGMIFNADLNFLFVAESGTGSVKAIPKDGDVDMRFVPPIITGLKEPRCVRFSPDGTLLYVCDMSSCCVWKVELKKY